MATNKINLKLSQRGIDVKHAGDQDLIFSGDFPMLKEEATGVVDTSKYGGTGYSILYEHNLNYVPFFLINDQNDEMVFGTSSFGVDKHNLYIPNGLTGNYRWSIYRLDLYTNYTAPIISTSLESVGTVSDSFVMKFAKKGKDVESDDLRDFTIHSRARSPLIHKVDHQQWTSDNTVHGVPVDLPYNPIVFGFATLTLDGRTYGLIGGGQATPRLNRETGKDVQITSSGLANTDTSIVIMKDPFLSRKVTTVSY